MPFVSIRMVEGRTEDQKNEIARRVAAAVSEVTGLPKTDVWITFEDISTADWYIGDRSIRAIRSGQAGG